MLTCLLIGMAAIGCSPNDGPLNILSFPSPAIAVHGHCCVSGFGGVSRHETTDGSVDAGELAAEERLPVSAVAAVANLPLTLVSTDDIPPSPGIFDGKSFAAVMSILFGPNAPSPVTPEVAEILDNWEAASRGLKTLRLDFSRTTYDLRSEVERVCDGAFMYAAPDHFRISLLPADLELIRRRQGKRIGKNGHRFRLEADDGLSFILAGSEQITIDAGRKAYECGSDRTDSLMQNIEAWMYRSLLIDIDADELRRTCSVRLLRRNDDNLVIVVTPRTGLMSWTVRECWVMIDAKSWHTTAVKCFGQRGDRETVYRVTERQVNLVLPDRCFNPDFEAMGYRNLRAGKGLFQSGGSRRQVGTK